MALTRLFLVVLLGITMPLVFFSRAAEAGGAVGVTYGRVANNLPVEASVVDLLKQNGITMVRIYDASPEVLTPLANTGIKVMVMMPNEHLTAAAANKSYALEWVKTNVTAYYPATQINGVAVGNEVFNDSPELNSVLVPAMTNVQAALAQLGLADAVKVSTPVPFDAIQDSYPPSAASFKKGLVPVMKPMLDFLQRTGSNLNINLYPFLTYIAQPGNISLDYALGNSKDGVRDNNTGLVYHSLLDAQLDATYFAMEKLMAGSSSSSSSATAGAATAANTAREGLGDSMAQSGMSVYIPETGWSSGGIHKGNTPLEAMADEADGSSTAATVANAQAYNNYVINRVLSGNTGTPHRPDADMDVYIFALFNENQKGSGADDIEQHFGLFYPNETKVYPFDFRGGAPTTTESWCVADTSADEDTLLEEMGYACDSGADCSAIEPGGDCFDPDTIVAHASYAFNSYYQCNDRASGSCDFDGVACIVYQQPKFGNCVLPSNNLKE